MSSPSPSSPTTSAPPFPLRDLHIDMLTECARQLDPASLLSFAAVSSTFSRAAEVVFRERCHRRGWKLPRLPRGADALAAAAGPHASWRALYRRRICGACSGQPGDFQVFEGRGAGGVGVGGGDGAATKLRYLLCAGCIGLVSGRLALLGLRVDLVGLSGRRLLSEAEERSAFGGGGSGRGKRGRRGGGGGGGGRGTGARGRARLR